MEFITILICLAIERWTVIGKKVRSYQLLEKTIAFVWTKIQNAPLPKIVSLIVILLPLLLIVFLIYFICLQFLYRLLAFLFSIGILFYCLGSFAVPADDQDAGHILVQANRNIFSVLFWFTLLGPVGAVLYRLNNCLVSVGISGVSELAEKFQALLEWIPIRLEVLSYALVSHFNLVIGNFIKHGLTGFNKNESLLVKSGHLALDDVETDLTHEAVLLLDRALVIWLVVIALIILL